MTAGTRKIGGLTYINTSCGRGLSGFESTKTWSGGDSPDPRFPRENPYACHILIRNEPVVRWGARNEYTGTVSSCWGGAASFEPLPTGKLDELRTNSLKRVLGKYKLHDFNMAIFLGELPETVGTVADSAFAIFRSYREVRKGRFGRAVKILRDINSSRDRGFSIDKYASSNWLALRYGWIPLIGDAFSAVEAYEATLGASRKKRKKLFRGRSKFVRKARSASAGPSSRTVNYDQVLLRTEAQPTTLQSLGFLDPELVAWELVPFSFVVDWFYDVSTYLELRAVLPKIQASYILTTKEHSLNLGYDGFSQFRIETVDVKRTIQSSVAVPPPRLKDPFEIKNTMVRLTDAVALGIALTRKHFTR